MIAKVLLGLVLISLVCCQGTLRITNYDGNSCGGKEINYIDFEIEKCYVPLATICDGYCDSDCSGEFKKDFAPCTNCGSASGESFKIFVTGNEFYQTNYASTDCSGTGTNTVASSGGCVELSATCASSQGVEIKSNSGSSGSSSSGSSSSNSNSNNSSSSSASALTATSAILIIALYVLL